MLLRVSTLHSARGPLRLGPGLLVMASALLACNPPLPQVLREPAVLESTARVVKDRFAAAPDGGNVFALRRHADGTVVALTGRHAVWFDSAGDLVRQVTFGVEEPLRYTSFLPSDEGRFRIAGQLPDESVVLLAEDGSVEARLPGVLAGAYTIGDLGADGDLEVLISARRDLRCRWPRLCTSLVVREIGSGRTAVADTPFILTDLQVVPPGHERAGQVVLLMYPNASGGTRFEVWDRELRPLSGWDTGRLGAFSLVERRASLRVLSAEEDFLVFRDLEGQVTERLALPHAGRLRNPGWSDLGDGWGVAVVSGVQDPRFLVAVYDPEGDLVYREVSAPHADDLLGLEDAPGRFLVPAGSEIIAYTVAGVSPGGRPRP